MAEYIDREVAIDAITDLAGKAPTRSAYDAIWKSARALRKIPAADVVPVVRCKDCKHLCVWNRKDIYAFCPKTNIVFLPFERDSRTFFCSFGERKPSADG